RRARTDRPQRSRLLRPLPPATAARRLLRPRDPPRRRGHGSLASPADVAELQLIPREEFDRVRDAELERDDRLRAVADMCRLNALVAVKRAGSGHLGSTFSAMDIVTFLLFEELNTATVGWGSPDRDVYFSSKGHDVPGLYAALDALG